MDGENQGKTYEQMDDLGVQYPYFWLTPILILLDTLPRIRLMSKWYRLAQKQHEKG